MIKSLLKKKAVLIIATMAVIVLSFYFIVVPKLINIEKYRPEIEKSIKQNVEAPIKLGKLSVSMTWNLGFKINTDNIEVKHADKSKFISTGPGSIEIFLPYLIKHKVNIREIRVNNVIANITRYKNGKFDIEQLIPRNKKSKKYKVILKNTSIIAQNYRIVFTDKYINPNKKYFIYGDSIRLKDFTPNKYIKIKANGCIISKNAKPTIFNVAFESKLPIKSCNFLKSNELSIDGNILNFYPGMYLPYLQRYLHCKYTYLSGSANIKFGFNLNSSIFRVTNFYIDSIINNLTAKIPDKGTVLDFYNTSRIKFNGSIDKNTLIFNDALIKNSNLTSRFSGKIYNFTSKKRTLNIKLIVENSRAKTIARLFPKEITVPLDPFRKLVKYDVDANVWANLIIRGYTKKPEIFGNVGFNDFSTKYITKNTPKGSGSINFLGKTFALDVNAYTDPKGYVKVKGIIGHIDRILALDITSTVVDLNKAQKLFLMISDIFKFKVPTVSKIQNVQGTGRVNMTVKGHFKPPGLYGYITILNANASYVGFYNNAHNVHGTINFDKNKIIYSNIIGYVKTSKVITCGYSTVQGYSDVKLTLPHLNLADGQVFINNSPLLLKTKNVLKSIENTKGYADLIINIVGTMTNVTSNGNVAFRNAVIKLSGYSEPFTNVMGTLTYTPENAYLKNITGKALNSPVVANGIITSDKKITLVLTSPGLDLASAKNFINNSPKLYKTANSISSFSKLSGRTITRLRLNGNIESQDLLKDLQLDVKTMSFINKNLGIPIELRNGQLTITKNALFTNGIEAVILGTPAKVKGKFTGFAASIIQPHLNITTQTFDIDKIRELAKAPAMPKSFRDSLNNFKNLKGKISADIDVYSNYYNIKVNFYNVSALYSSMNTPITIDRGSITINPTNIAFSKLPITISKSSAYLNGHINNYASNPELNLFIASKINSTDIEKYINPMLEFPIKAQGIIPMTSTLNGSLNSWNIDSKLILNKGTDISYQGEIGLPEDTLRVLSLNANGNKNRININNLDISMSNNTTQLPITQISETDLKNLVQILNANGSIVDLPTTNPLFNKFNITIKNPISIKLLNPLFKSTSGEPFFTDGAFAGNITLNGKLTSPYIIGNAYLNKITIPSKETSIDSANVIFNDNDIILTDSNINIDDSEMNIKATLANSFDLPITVKQISITSPALNIDRIVEALKQPSSQESQMTELPPIIIENGKLNANELVISNLITSNVNSDFNFTPDWLLSMNNINFETAGGTIVGQVFYNMSTAELSGNLKVQNMEANAAATTLLSLPNEVYGTLNGIAEFRSRGRSSRELIANSNGTSTFQITKGRLVRLGSLEYLLRAANVVQSGIAGLNLNNILDLIAPQKTGYFQILKGSVTAKDGILKTDGIASRGKNLSMFLTGNLDMVTNNADIRILGRVSKKVSGLLGPVGNLSINTFIDFIPGIGFLPTTPNTGIIDIIPGLSRIPVLGLGGKRKYRRFVVLIKGDLYNPTSVKSFRWLD